MSEKRRDLETVKAIAFALHADAKRLELYFQVHPEYIDLIYNPQWAMETYGEMMDKSINKLETLLHALEN